LRHLTLALFVIFPGVAGVIVFGYYALVDWDALQQAYKYFAIAIQNKSNLEILFVAEAQQNIHRINLFADGVWTLLSAILASIGVHGICAIPPRRLFVKAARESLDII
jgi:hypothetical protein